MSIQRVVESFYGILKSGRREELPPMVFCLAAEGDPEKAEDGVKTINVDSQMYVSVSLLPDRIRRQVMAKAKKRTLALMDHGDLHPITRAELQASNRALAHPTSSA